MQSKDGGWGAFDADNTRELVNKLPFCDFGAVIDPPSADVTAHIVEALAAEGLAGCQAARRGVVWLLRDQEPDGSWFGRWGANYVYGTGAAVPALIAAGVLPAKPVHPAGGGLAGGAPEPDGGWGEDLRSYDDPAVAGRGDLHRLADRLGAARPARAAGAVARGARCRPRAWLAGRHPARRRDLGRAGSSPAPASPATSTSTTTCTGWSSRSAPSAATCADPQGTD